MPALPSIAAPMWPLSVARIIMGVLWLLALRWKLPPDFDAGSQRSLREWLELAVAHPTIELYGSFIDSVVLPNFTAFAWSVFVIELIVGLGLLTGTTTRAVAFVGLLLSLNLGIGLSEVPGEWPWSYAMMAMWHGTLLVAGAGRLWGVDQYLRDRFDERSPILALT